MIFTDFAGLNRKNAGQNLTVGGFVHTIRDHGGLVFIDLRSGTDLLQVVAQPISNSTVFEVAQDIHNEYVIKVRGELRMRSADSVNPNLPTGEIELVAETIDIISKAKPLPFDIHASEKDLANEELRLKYRYLDLRREKLKKQLIQYHQMNLAARNWFAQEGFVEIATPILANSSPEGARDYLVPSRLHAGKFYALPQSPQQFKQLLMVGGFNKYFQVAPCFRDEDPRSDRHPGDFYQYDAEIAWAEEEDIIQICERLVREVFMRYTEKRLKSETFIRLTYQEAMEKYGSDKPDLRYALPWKDAKPVFAGSGFKVFADLCEKEEARVQALVIKNAVEQFSRSDLDRIQDIGRSLGLPGIAYIQYTTDGAKSPLFKFFGEQEEEKKRELQKYFEAESGDLILFVANDNKNLIYKAQSAIRKSVAEKLNLIDENELQFVWIHGFPFFEQDDKTGKIDFGHNPFSVWQGGLEALQEAKAKGNIDLLKLTARQYDIAVNGYEILSGGVRNQNMEALMEAFEIVGYTKEEVVEKFGHMVEAYSYGAPVHAGFGLGIDRFFMVLQGEENIREIIAFPKNGSGMDVMLNSPSTVRDIQLKELKIRAVE